MKISIACLALFCCLCWSCSKTDPPTDSNDPVFMVNYGPEPAGTLTAGLDKVYLFTSYAILDDKFRSISSFTKVDCPDGDCPGSLRLEFYDRLSDDSIPNFYTTAFSFADSLGIIGQYQSNIFNLVPSYDSLLLTVNMGGQSRSFDFINDKTTVEWLNVPQQITLDAKDSTGFFSSRTSFTFLPAAPESYPKVNIRATREGNSYILQAITSGVSNPTFSWSTLATGSTITSDTTVLPFNYSVTVTDVFGNTASAALSSLIFPYQDEWTTAQLGIESILLDEDVNVGSFAVQWVDNQGAVWRSDRELQPADAFFRPSKIEAYDRNEKGDATVKLSFTFKCLMFSPLGEWFWFEGDGVTAFAYPE